MSNEPKRTPTYKELIERIATEYAKRSSANVFQLAHKEDFLAGAKWQSEQTQSELESLRAENAELIEALRGMVYIAQDSSGVYGYHKNGDLADWDEFNEVDNAQTTLAKYEKP